MTASKTCDWMAGRLIIRLFARPNSPLNSLAYCEYTKSFWRSHLLTQELGTPIFSAASFWGCLLPLAVNSNTASSALCFTLQLCAVRCSTPLVHFTATFWYLPGRYRVFLARSLANTTADDALAPDDADEDAGTAETAAVDSPSSEELSINFKNSASASMDIAAADTVIHSLLTTLEAGTAVHSASPTTSALHSASPTDDPGSFLTTAVHSATPTAVATAIDAPSSCCSCFTLEAAKNALIVPFFADLRNAKAFLCSMDDWRCPARA